MAALLRALAAVLVFSGASALGATAYLETFAADDGGWGDRDAGKMTVTRPASGGNPGGYLRGEFAAQSFPIPEIDAFAATGRAATAAFVGDYSTAELLWIGFDARAEGAPPAADRLVLRIRSGALKVERFLNGVVTATGVWFTARVPLDPAAGWIGDLAQWQTLFTNVTAVEIEVRRNDASAQALELDNIAVGRAPLIQSIAVSGGVVELGISSVLSQVAYRVQSATEPSAVWSNATSFVAGGTTETVVVTNHAPTRLWRVALP